MGTNKKWLRRLSGKRLMSLLLVMKNNLLNLLNQLTSIGKYAYKLSRNQSLNLCLMINGNCVFLVPIQLILHSGKAI